MNIFTNTYIHIHTCPIKSKMFPLRTTLPLFTDDMHPHVHSTILILTSLLQFLTVLTHLISVEANSSFLSSYSEDNNEFKYFHVISKEAALEALTIGIVTYGTDHPYILLNHNKTFDKFSTSSLLPLPPFPPLTRAPSPKIFFPKIAEAARESTAMVPAYLCVYMQIHVYNINSLKYSNHHYLFMYTYI